MQEGRLGLKDRIGDLLAKSRAEQGRRRLTVERQMEDVDRRLRHLAFLVADLDLRCVIPRLRDLASMFPQASEPRKQGLSNVVWIDLLPTPEYPAQARISVSMAPLPLAESLRVAVSVIMLPVFLPYEHEAWIDLAVQNPDTKKLGEFLDARIEQFVKDYLRVRDPDSPYHDGQKMTDPVCQMTFSVSEAAGSSKYQERTYYFCVESCRRKFEAAPEHYIVAPPSFKDMPLHQQSPLLETTPGEVPRESAFRTRRG
jgi:YHS domain-containing protein